MLKIIVPRSVHTALFLNFRKPESAIMIRSTLLSSIFLTLATVSFAQYGAYDASMAKSVSNTELIVILENGNPVASAALKTAVEQFWTKGDFTFSTPGDLAASGFLPGKTYLAHHIVQDPKRFEMNYLSLVQGWKMKKSQQVLSDGNGLMEVPADQVIASILFDPEAVNTTSSPMMGIYVKHLQDYVDQVSKGKIRDQTTADRLYGSRTRMVKEGTLQLSKGHVDKTFPDEASVKEVFSSSYAIKNQGEVMELVQAPTKEINVADVVLTGEYKTKHCFKRVFNAATGELMYLADEPSLQGKKEGFLIDDMKSIARAR